MVYNVNEKKDHVNGIIETDGQGKHFSVSVDDKQRLIDYVNLFHIIGEQRRTKSI